MNDGDLLLSLLEHDLTIARAEKALDELPEKRAILQLRRRVKEIDSVRDRAIAAVHALEAGIAKASDEVALVNEKIDAEQEKVTSGIVANPKELQHLTREIESLARRRDALETDELELMQKAEDASAKVATIDETLAEGHRKEADLIRAFQVKGGALQTQIRQATAEREAIAAELTPGLLQRYESLRDQKHGIAVGQLEHGMCTACRTQLPAAKAQAIEAGPSIAECPNCRRLLVVRQDATT
jgi:hypothetical protein